MAYILKKRKEENQLPQQFEKYANINAKKLPTIRSVAVARPGWCIVEADYQTAEMRGLAYIAGDEMLIKMIEEPDDCFAKIKPEHVPEGYDAEDIVIRIKWPDYVKYPVDKDRFLNTCTIDGTIVMEATPDMFLHDENGNVVHPKYDLHWSVVELARKTAREVMDKKKDRGAGKTTNFCIAQHELVDVLRRGVPMRVPIESVELSDRVWDGTMWVSHAGSVCHGRKIVRQYCGLWATDNHAVWSRSGKKIKFGQARTETIRLKASRGRGLQRLKLAKKSELETGVPAKIVPCYDIMNAGPMHRYTCSGVLVSNSSSYGGMAASIARKIESDTGNKPEIEEVEALLTAIRDRQPVATKFFEEMERLPEEHGFYRCASGRIRHFHVLASGISGLSARTRDGQISAVGREARNTPMQESVAATASRACVSMLDFKMKTGLQGYATICLYDSVVVHCPWSERRIWEKALKLFMYLAVGWKYHGRILRYPIDIEYNGAWSTKAAEPFNSLYKTPEWMPTRPCHAVIEKWLDLECEKYEAHPGLSLLPQDS